MRCWLKNVMRGAWGVCKTHYALRITLFLVFLAACQEPNLPPTATLPVVTAESEPVEVTRIVRNEVLVAEPTVVPTALPVKKDLVVCLPGQVPLETLYFYGLNERNMPALQPILHALYEPNFTTRNYGYQAVGIEKMPSLADGDAYFQTVMVVAGDQVIDAKGRVTTVAEGITLLNERGETIVFRGNPIPMSQMVVDFTLKPRVWADGIPVTAEDSVYSFELLANADTPSDKFLAERTARYFARDARTVEWVGLPGFRDKTYFTNIAQPLPRHLWGKLSADALIQAEISAVNPFGDGAFQIDDWRRGESLRLIPNPYYYREERSDLDSVTFRFVADVNQALSSLLAGECHIITQHLLDVGQTPALREAEATGLLVPHFQMGTVYEHLDFGIQSYGNYRERRPDWFADARVRQAIAHCTNRQRMVDELLFGLSPVGDGYVPAFHPLYPDNMPHYIYNPAQGNALLDEAGFMDVDEDGVREFVGEPVWFVGTPFKVKVTTDAGILARQRLAEMFQADMAVCGIQVEVEILEPEIWYGTDGEDSPLFGRRFDMGIFAWRSEIEPNCRLYTTQEITGPQTDGFCGWSRCANASGFSDEAYDTACAVADYSLVGEVDYVTAHEEALRIYGEKMPAIPLFWRVKVAVTRPEVRNFTLDATHATALWNWFEIDLESE
jgi:peptide/nickel transport system substrate-binding protein